MPYVVSDGVHCARCQHELQGSDCTAFGYEVCKECGKVFKELSRKVAEWDLFNVYFTKDNNW